MQNNKDNRYNLGNFEAIFKEFLQSQQVSPITLKNYLSDIRHFFGWFSLFVESNSTNDFKVKEQNTIFTLLTTAAIEQYKIYLEQNNIPLKTINRRLSTLRKFCTLAIAQGWMNENVAKKVSNVGNIGIIYSVETTHESSPPVTEQKSIQTEFQQYISSQQSNPKESQLIIDDINEFFTFINS